MKYYQVCAQITYLIFRVNYFRETLQKIKYDLLYCPRSHGRRLGTSFRTTDFDSLVFSFPKEFFSLVFYSIFADWYNSFKLKVFIFVKSTYTR
jgi:hypothetical protein